MGDGIVKIKKLTNNAKLPVRRTERSTVYDIAAAQEAVAPQHWNFLVRTGLSVDMVAKLNGGITPLSGLILKKFIDVGAGVINSDYRGEVGITLFNFGTEFFEIKSGKIVLK